MNARAFVEADPEVILLAMGGMFNACLAAGRQLFFEHEIEVQIVVPFQIYPFDTAALAPLLSAASAIFVVEESTAGGTWGAEVAAVLARDFPQLRAPVQLIHSADSIIPSARHLEQEVLVQSRDIVDRVARTFSR